MSKTDYQWHELERNSVITTTKPDKSPLRLLSNTTDGPLWPYPLQKKNKKLGAPFLDERTGSIEWVDPSYDQPELTGKINPLETDPSGLASDAPGAKLDAGKQRPWLCIKDFSSALSRVADVTTVGANKYSPGGWLEVSAGETRYMDAFGRHMLAYGQGKRIDDGPKGTGCLHLSQMIWNLLAVLELQEREAEHAH
jgi:hypothetical protein